MSRQTIKQQARRAALDVQAKRRRERAEREKRLETLAVQVLTAIGERDAAVAEAERRAGDALQAMTVAEGLTLREAVDWCGDEFGMREAIRLRRLVDGDEAEDREGGEAEDGESGSASEFGGSGCQLDGWMRPVSPR